jgi:hypothetical protein
MTAALETSGFHVMEKVTRATNNIHNHHVNTAQYFHISCPHRRKKASS